MKKLKRFNLIMGIIHLLQGIAMTVLFFAVENINNFRPSIYTYFLKYNAFIMRLVTNPKIAFYIPFVLFVASFFFISALFHLLTVIFNKKYNEDLEKKINQFRWYEYAISSSIMIVLIAILFGVYDLGALILIFGLNASMNLFGLLMEKMNQYTEKPNWLPFIFGSFAGIIPWIVIVLYAFGNANPAEVPGFVYLITLSYLVLFNIFPLNMILQYKKIGKWKDYLYGEKVYIILSLVAKTLLAWLVFFGIMQPV